MKNIVVIGGGPSGLEASANLHKMGYNVILVEKSPALGGHLAKWDRLFPQGIPAKDVLEGMISNINGVKYFLNANVQSINALGKSYNVILDNGITVLADAVLFATGFDLFKAEKKEEYGYGIYERVITNADLENWFRTKEDSRVANNPKRIGFVHCVGSRDEKAGNRYCSKVCCATAVKQACEIKQEFPDAEVFCFYMDLRMFGRGYEDLYLSAQKEYGVRFIRGRVSEVAENINKELVVKAEDTLSGKPIKVTLDLLVLMAGMQNCSAGAKVAGQIGVAGMETDGFFETKDTIYSLQQSNKPGVFFAGACTGPKTLPDSLHEARAAALAIHNYLQEGEKR
ncbi:MAG: CoB--CoM heterodisulfide reductase iron-sulfur subunit A family protein [Bacteroidales bacterium]|nr:CoB--CoM heterodisulfide reductase iron-sulfur subunit A family protein [Bacteroidales bacterium]